MANRYAVKAGNWSDPTVWDGGTLPGPADVVRPNTFAVTIDQDVDVAELRHNAAAPALGGGVFDVFNIPGGGRVIKAEVFGGVNNAAGVLRVSATSGSLTVNGNLTAGTVTGASAMYVAGGGTLVVTINGSIFPPTAGNGSHGVVINALVGSTTIINGNVTGGEATTNCAGVYFAVTGTVIVHGTCTGGSTPALQMIAAGCVVDVDGPVVASLNGPAIRSTGATSVIRCRGPFVHAANNRAPIVAESFMVYTAENTRWEMKDDSASPAGGASVILTSYVSDSPAPEDVRAGVTYGPTGTLTGTLDMPPPEAVAFGTPVDDTTGTAALTQAAVAEVVGPHLAAALNPVGSG